ncbi:FG-GAP-like repeat-containing protein [Streptomyces sp. NBC_01443]|uniref:FG-GAP-like repeat-containing protein n=1 Tax=Streptomyces sp. NBC_01443 TaxID=2903868 RepID=UPI002257DF1F|nr:FG-GAP-like repeat-containing protein [Streptomyces sp. NBC_01443]MCX4632670.1 hypothetical protein [Streptomyces sp. NBC_01443]
MATETAGYGYNSSCPDNWVAPDITGLVADAANNRWGALSLGFAAPNESDSYYWKKLLANGEYAPYLDITYNTPPDVPTAANMSTYPGGPCVTTGPGTSIGKTNITFQVKGNDRDGLQYLKQLQIEVWDAESGQQIRNEWISVNSDGVVTTEVPLDKFTSGRKYYWLSRAVDSDGVGSPGSGPLDSGGGGWCTFTVDHVVPPAPGVSSSDFPGTSRRDDNLAPQWSVNPAGTKDQAIKLLGNGTAAADIREYQWSLNRPAWDQKSVPAADGTADLKIQVNTAGPNILYARTVTKSGNISPQTEYLFYVTPGNVQDTPGDVTGDGHPDLLAVDSQGNLRTYAGDDRGDTDAYIPGAVKDGLPVTSGYWKDDSGRRALIAHSTDWYPGDGITDLIARMPNDGKLYVYPGTGTGQFDVGRRLEVILPASAPDPATFRQIVATEDITGDGLADMFALDTAGGFWFFNGWTGASFNSYKKLAANWAPRDIVGVRDISGDNIPDLLYRNDANASLGLVLRKGKAGTNGGVDITSLQAAANAEGGQDYTYGTTSWSRAERPMILGTPDTNGDGVPDVWATGTDANQLLFLGSRTAIGGASGRDEDGWNTFLTIG